MDVFQVVLGIMAGVGGVGVIILGVIKFASGIIAERLQKKYQLQFDKELEKYKAGLENKVYISKTRFDAEFLIYQKLTKSSADCVKQINILIPSGLMSQLNNSSEIKLEEQQLGKAAQAFATAQDELNMSIPFIPKGLSDKYIKLLHLSQVQLTRYLDKWKVCSPRKQTVKSSLEEKDYARTDEINSEFNDINIQLRDYLSRIDII